MFSSERFLSTFTIRSGWAYQFGSHKLKSNKTELFDYFLLHFLCVKVRILHGNRGILLLACTMVIELMSFFLGKTMLWMLMRKKPAIYDKV